MILLRGKVGHRRLHGPYQSQLVGPSLFLGCIFAVRVGLYGLGCTGFAVWICPLALSLLGLFAAYSHTAMRFVAFTACLYLLVVIQ